MKDHGSPAPAAFTSEKPIRSVYAPVRHPLELNSHREEALDIIQHSAAMQSLGDNLSDPLLILSPNPDACTVLYANQAFADLFGIPGNILQNQELTDFLPFAQADCLRSHCRQAALIKTSVQYDDIFRFPGGELHATFSITPVIGADKLPIQFLCAVREMADPRQAHRTLRKVSRRLVNTLECITDAFISLNRNWEFTFLNYRAELLLDHSWEELNGRSIWEVLPHLHGTLVESELRRCLNKQIPVALEDYKSSKGYYLNLSAYPSQDGISVYVQDITQRVQALQKNQESMDSLRRSVDSIARAMAKAVDMRDPYTADHQRRVSIIACGMAREAHLPEEQIEIIRIAALLHDIGKIAVPSEILCKPGLLSEAEMSIVRTHAQVGYDILKEINFCPTIALVALQHHERLNGSGYPHGLAGEDIIEEARMLAVADVVEAMSYHRPYRPTLGVEKALEEVISGRDTLYEGRWVDACLSLFERCSFDYDAIIASEAA